MRGLGQGCSLQGQVCCCGLRFYLQGQVLLRAAVLASVVVVGGGWG